MADHLEATDVHLKRCRIHWIAASISGMKQVTTKSRDVDADRIPMIMKIRWMVVIIVQDNA